MVYSHMESLCLWFSGEISYRFNMTDIRMIRLTNNTIYISD
jgi:hypothetical protein